MFMILSLSRLKTMLQDRTRLRSIVELRSLIAL